MAFFNIFKRLGFASCDHQNRDKKITAGITFWQCPDCGEDNYRDR